jgi:hypothetical protein
VLGSRQLAVGLKQQAESTAYLAPSQGYLETSAFLLGFFNGVPTADSYPEN